MSILASCMLKAKREHYMSKELMFPNLYRDSICRGDQGPGLRVKPLGKKVKKFLYMYCVIYLLCFVNNASSVGLCVMIM